MSDKDIAQVVLIRDDAAGGRRTKTNKNKNKNKVEANMNTSKKEKIVEEGD